MDIFSIINLLGGLALFLYGMSVMSQGLEKLAGGKLEGILRSMTSSKFKSLLLGLGVTAVIQSSSAVTVMLVGLVNSSIMTLEQSVGVIMGTNIGTTVTAWLLSLVGISSDNIFLKLLKPEAFSPIIALIGVLMMMVSKSDKRKDAGSVMLGFAVLMYCMNFMSSSMEPLKDMPEFAKVLTAFNNPVFGILAGILVTAVIQSSSASVGILQALSMTSGLTYGMVIPIIMGQNIGTCVTSVISSIGVSKNAKRVAVVHIAFNIIGTIIFMVVFSISHYLINFGFINKAVTPVDIAIIHSLFNIFTTVIIFPFAEKLVPISHKFVGGEEDDEMEVFLDKRLLFTPSIAVEEARAKTNEMVEIRPEYKNEIERFYTENPEDAKKQFGDEPFELKNIIKHWVLNKEANFIPTDTVYVTIDKEAVRKSGMMMASDSIPDKMTISLSGKRALYKGDLMMLEIISNANWTRPIYVAMTVGADNYMNLGDNFVQEGLANRITPFTTSRGGKSIEGTKNFDTEKTYANMMTRYKYGGVSKPGVYIDETVMRMCNTHRRLFAQLALNLISEGKKDKALKALDRCMKELPAYNIPMDFMSGGADLAKAYALLGKTKEAQAIIDSVWKNAYEHATYYLSLNGNNFAMSQRDVMTQLYILNNMRLVTEMIDMKKSKTQVDTIHRLTEVYYDKGGTPFE